MNKITMLMLIAVCSLVVAGCSSSTTKSADTPKQALENMRQAMLNSDADAFAACFDATEKQAELLKEMCGVFGKMISFQKAMVKEYGEDVVQGNKITGPMGDFEDDKWLDDATVEIDGDKATVTKDNNPAKLVKKDGAWKIDIATMTGSKDNVSDEDMAKVAKMMSAMGDAMDSAQKNIGKEGYTAEKINQEMGQAMMKAMMGGMEMPTPPAPE